MFINKESVEPNRLSGWRFWNTLTQINNTPHSYWSVEQEYRHDWNQYRVTSVIATLVSMKFSRFPSKDKSDYTFIN